MGAKAAAADATVVALVVVGGGGGCSGGGCARLAPLDASVLEPDLDLGLGEAERGGQVGALAAHHVLLTLELELECV